MTRFEDQLKPALEQHLEQLHAQLVQDYTQLVEPIADTAGAAGATKAHQLELGQAFSRAARTQERILTRLTSGTLPKNLVSEDTGKLDRPVPAVEALADLSNAEVADALAACETSIRDCKAALRSLQAKDGSGPVDFWQGEDSATHHFTALQSWFEVAVRLLRRLRQHRGLEAGAATQFQPLDPASPTVTIQVRLPQSLRDAADEAATAGGVTRSELIRGLLEEHLGHHSS